jgi:hypothetical protein
MCRYKLAVLILVLLSVFNFVPVFAAPVPVQEVREACADVADGGEDVIIVSGKRAEEGQDPLTQASPGQLSTSLPDPPGSPSTPDYASGVHQETTTPIQLPSSASGELQRPPYASSGTELPWHSSVTDDTEPHLLTPGGEVQPGTTSEFLPSSSVRTKTYPFVSTTEIGPATPTPSESSDEITPAPPSNVDPQKPKPKSVWGKLTSKSKSLFRKLGRITKSLFSEMVDNPHLQIRISATTSGAVNEAQRKLQGTAHTEAYVSAFS